MKLNFYILCVALAAVSAGFSSCSDGDDDVTDRTELQLPADVQRVKIGAENRIALPIINGAGNYNAYSLNPEIAEVTADENGQLYIEGYKNGITDIVVSDQNCTYKRIPVSVYTTDILQLSYDLHVFTMRMGTSETFAECEVTLGNGGYSIQSDNAKVTPTIDAETGEIVITATAGKDQIDANVTVTDCSGISGIIKITVVPTFEAFTDEEIVELCGKTVHDVNLNGTQPSYFRYMMNGSTRYGSMIEESTDSTEKFGFYYYYAYGTYIREYSTLISYPSGTPIGVETDGVMRFAQDSDAKDYAGKVIVHVDNEEKRVATWYNIDYEAEKIDRGYVVYIK